jgi:hypothetical protein
MTADKQKEYLVQLTCALIASGHYTNCLRADDNDWPWVISEDNGKDWKEGNFRSRRTACAVDAAWDILDEIDREIKLQERLEVESLNKAIMQGDDSVLAAAGLPSDF